MRQPLTREASARLASDLDHGIPLPASWYTDPAFLALETERIFRRTWQYLGRADQFSRVGDYMTGEVGGVPVVVVRGEEGLRGFVNICRHRRHLVMSGAGCRKTLQCPYHGWCYDLDGCLVAAPRSDREEGFDLSGLSLLPVQVDTWGPFVLANADVDAPPLAQYLGTLPGVLAGNGLDLGRLRFHERNEWRTEGNWKALVENYLECYHCPVAHPGFSSVVDIDRDAYRLDAHEWWSGQSAPVRVGARQGKGAAYDARGEVEMAQYYFLWPNLTLSIHPGHLNLTLHVWLPDGPEHTRGFTEFYFAEDVSEEFARELMAFSRQVGVEDHALVASVQAGLRAGEAVEGRLLRESEKLIDHFQRLVLGALAAK